MKNFAIQKYFDLNKISSENNSVNKVSSQINFETKLSQEQKIARESAIMKLDFYINTPTAFSAGEKKDWNRFTDGAKEMMTLNSTREEIREQMRDIRKLLLKEYKESDWDVTIKTHLNRINSDSTANLEFFAIEMSKRVFLQRIVGPTLAAKILSESPQQISVEKQNLLQEKIRLEKFLQSFVQMKQKDMNDKVRGNKWMVTLDSAVRHTQKLLMENKIEEAAEYFARAIGWKYRDINVHNIIGNDESLADAMRKIGDTSGVVNKEVALNRAKNMDGNENADTKELYEQINQSLSVENPVMKSKAEKAYNEMVAKLHPNSPTYKELTANPDATKAMMEASMVLDDTIGNFIKKRGSENLPKILRDFDDMKGLHGITNWSDENVKLARELIIMTASMIVTLWLGSIATAAAGSVRIANAGRWATAANYWKKGNYLKSIGSASVLPVTAPLARGVQYGAKWVSIASQAASKNAVTSVIGSAFTFTSVDQMLRSAIWTQSGEKTANFSDFMTNFSKNTAMFAAFGGMERFLNKTIVSRFVPKDVPPTTKVKIGELAVLSVGDIAVMQALHAAENGKLEWSWGAAFSAFVFRAGVTSVEKIFPRLMEKFKKSKEGISKEERMNSIREVNDKMKNAEVWDMLIIRVVDVNDPQKVYSISYKKENVNKMFANQKNTTEWRLVPENNNWVFQLDDTLKPYIDRKSGRVFLNKDLKWKFEVINATIAPFVKNVPQNTTIVRTPEQQKMFNYLEGILNTPQPWKNIETPDKVKWRFDGKESVWVKADPNGAFPKQNATKKTTEQMKKDYLDGFDSHIVNQQVNNPNPSVNNQAKWVNKTEKELNKEYLDGKLKEANDEIKGILEKEFAHTADDRMYTFQNGTESIRITRIISGDEHRYVIAKVENGKHIVLYPGKPITSFQDVEQFLIAYNTNKFTNIAKRAGLNKISFKEGLRTLLDKINPKIHDDLNFAIDNVKNGDLQKMKSFFHEHWKAIFAGGMALRVWDYLNQEKTNPFVVLPATPPEDPQTAFEQCVLCFLDNPSSTIDFTRKNGILVLNEDNRVAISRKNMEKTYWKEMLVQWNEVMVELGKYEEENVQILQNKMNEMLANPSVENVKDFQRCINMKSEDTKYGQDGIIGPNTTKAILDFIQSCRNHYNAKNIPVQEGNYSEVVMENGGIETIRVNESMSENVAADELIVEPRKDLQESENTGK